MENQNTSNHIENIEGATRLNQSTNKVFDYENAIANKIKIYYADGTSRIQTTNNTMNNGVCTIKFDVYVPDENMIEKIDIISNDEETIYQSITQFPEDMFSTKLYRFQQDVYCE
jgi:hypothetical protein